MTDRELAIRVQADLANFTAPLTRGISDVKSFAGETIAQFEKVEQKAESLKNVWKSMFEAFVAFEIGDALKKLAEQADRAHESLEIAATSARALGKSFDAHAMEQWIEGFAKSAKSGGYSIESMRDAVQKFAAIGLDASQIQRALGDTAELAARYHLDFAEAVHIVTMILTGHVEIAARYGMVVKDAAGNLLTVNQMMAQFETGASAAATRAEGLAGATGRADNAITQMREHIGEGFVGVFAALSNAVEHVASVLAQTPPIILQLAGGLGALLGGLTAVGLALPAVKLGLEFLADGASLALTVLRPLYAFFIGSFVNALREIVIWLNAARDAFVAMTIVEWLMSAPIMAIIGSLTLLIAIVVEVTRKFQDLKDIWQAISHFFGSTIGPDVGAGKKPPYSQPPDPTAAAKWLKAQEAAIDHQLAQQQLMVEKAQAALASATSAKSGFMGGLDPTAVRTAAEVRREEQLIRNELDAQQRVRAALEQQRQAELQAAQHYAELEKSVPATKDHDAQVAELQKKADEATLAAEKIQAEINRIGDGAKKAGLEIRNAWLDHFKGLADQIAAIMSAGVDKANDLLENRVRGIQTAGQISSARGDNNPVSQAQDALTIAQIQAAEANNKLQEAMSAWLDPNAIAERAKMSDDARTLEQQAFDAKIRQLTAELQHADDLSRVAKATYETAANDLYQFASSIAKKLNIPGLGVSAVGNSGVAFSFNPMTFLIAAFEQTKSFADIMNVVNELMRVFATILDAIRPVIDLLLKAVIAIVNIFIDLWNAIARLLRLLGIHIELLQQLNYDLSGIGQTALIQISHDIPTLTELASGNIAPIVAPGGTGSTSLVGAIQNQTNEQQGWFGSLITDAGILLAIDWLTHGKFFADMGGFISKLWSSITQGFANLPNAMQGALQIGAGFALLDSHTQGIIGILEKVLGALLVISGLLQMFTGSGLFGGSGFLGLFNKATGNGGGLLSNIFGGGQSGSGAYTIDTSTGIMTDSAGNVIGNVYSGTGMDVAPFNDIVDLNGNVVGGAADAGGEYGQGALDAANASGGVAGAGFSLGGLLTGLGIGAGVGGLDIFGGNKGNSTIGGALGGAAAGAFGTAISAALGISTGGLGFLVAPLLGGILGSGIGSLFGPKGPEPDITNTQGYGQFMADFGVLNLGQPQSGTPYGDTHNIIANGQQFNIDPTIAQATQGMGIGDWLAKLLQTSPSFMQAALGSSFSQVQQMFQNWNDATVQGKGNNFNTGSGSFSYTDLQQVGMNALQAINSYVQQNASGLTQTLEPLTNQVGTATQAIKTMTDSLSYASNALRTTLPIGMRGGSATTGQVTINVETNLSTGDINNSADLDEFYNNIAERTQYAVKAGLTAYSTGQIV